MARTPISISLLFKRRRGLKRDSSIDNFNIEHWVSKLTVMPYAVQAITPADAPGLAQTMMNAFWEDPHWKLMWGEMSLEDIVSDCAQRLPWNLINDRSVKRHLKVVDMATGEIVGYSRYLLPENVATIEWLEAKISEPSTKERESYEKSFKDVTHDGRIRNLNHMLGAEMGNPLAEAEEEIMKKGGPYLCTSHFNSKFANFPFSNHDFQSC